MASFYRSVLPMGNHRHKLYRAIWFLVALLAVSSIAQSGRALTGLVLGLGLAGTGLAYIIYYYIVSQMGAVTASSVTYVPPIVAVAIGAVVVGERIEATDYFAAALILVGVILLNFSRTAKTTD